MIASPGCPSRDRLTRLSGGEIYGDEIDELYDHLDSCLRCQQIFLPMETPDDHFRDLIAGITPEDLKQAEVFTERERLNETAVSVVDFFSNQAHASRREPTLQLPCTIRQYNVTRLIGVGGMGEVYEAKHTKLKRRAAIKVIRSFRQEDPAAYDQFIKEIETAGQLGHPNLVLAHDAWEDKGCHYLIQEYLEGESLHELGQHQKIGTTSEVIEILIGTCRGLDRLHAQGFVHRDVTPRNVMRLHDGTIKLIDFGLTLATESGKTIPRSRAGTPGYMSPEQTLGNVSIDHRSDIYSVGRVLMYLLSRLPEAVVETKEATTAQQLTALAERLTQQAPKDRLQSVYALIVQLEQLQLSATSKHPPPDAPPIVPPPPSVQGTQETRQTLPRIRTAAPADAAKPKRRGMGGLILVALMLAAGGFAAFQISFKTDRHATVLVENHQPGDVIKLTSEDGRVRSVELGDPPKFVVDQGAYQLSLDGPDDRQLSPANITVTGLDQLTVRIEDRPAHSDRAEPIVQPPLKQEPIIAGQWLEDGHAIQVQQRDKYFIARSRYKVRSGQEVVWAMSGTIESDGTVNAQLGMIDSPPGWPGIQTFTGKLRNDGSIRFSVTSYRRGAVPEPENDSVVWLPNGPRASVTSDASSNSNITGKWTTGGSRPEPIDYIQVGEDFVAFLRYEHDKGPVWWVQVGTFTPNGDFDGIMYHSLAPGSFPRNYWKGRMGPDGVIRGTRGPQRDSNLAFTLTRFSGATRSPSSTTDQPTRSFTPQTDSFFLTAPFTATDIRTARRAWNKDRKLPETITIGMPSDQAFQLEFVLLPPGTFEMGMPAKLSMLPDNRQEWADSSKPAHSVTISQPFYLSRYEVTQKQFRDVKGGGLTPVAGDGTEFPATQVPWQACVEFCNRLTQSGTNIPTGGRVRLPTEAEWEYACRAGTKSRFWLGDQIGPSEASLRIKGRKMKLEPVVAFAPNAFGLYQMHGNVSEWCLDWFSPDYYASSRSSDPKGPADGSRKVIRGGGYSNPPFSATSYWRQSHEPTTRSGNIGLRPVLALPAR